MHILSLRRVFDADHSSSTYEFFALDRLTPERRAAVQNLTGESARRHLRFHYRGEWSDIPSEWPDALLTLGYDILVSESYDWWAVHLLHAERCITFHNENPHEFPDWLDSAGHDCLVGCLHCQRVCPQNRDVWHWIEEGGEFSSQETALLLADAALERLPAETVQKLEQNDLVGLLDVLPRNLRAALRSRSM